MTTNALMELATCPFCGGEPELQGFQDSEDSIHWSVKCKSCGALSGETKADSTPDQEFAITSWNTRSQLRTAAAEGGARFWITPADLLRADNGVAGEE